MDALKLKTNEPTTGENLIKLASTIDQFEQYARPHASQMARLAEALAIRVGLSAADLNSIKLAALLHDIGELAIDITGVRQAGPLDFKQRIELWRHPIVSEQQLAKRGLSRQAQLLVRWHHEWWNGTGYPDMLSGEAIPIGARILRLVDSYDALTARRPYREAYREEQAIEMIAAAAGIEFDPALVKIFFQMLAEMAAAAQEAAHQTSPPEPVLAETLNQETDAEPPVSPDESAVVLTTPAAIPILSSDSSENNEQIADEPIATNSSQPESDNSIERMIQVEAGTDETATTVEAINEETISDEAIIDEVASDELIDNEAIIDEVSNDEVTNNESISDEKVGGEHMKDDPLKTVKIRPDAFIEAEPEATEPAAEPVDAPADADQAVTESGSSDSDKESPANQ